jgi:hypothetical protein
MVGKTYKGTIRNARAAMLANSRTRGKYNTQGSRGDVQLYRGDRLKFNDARIFHNGDVVEVMLSPRGRTVKIMKRVRKAPGRH